MLIDKSIKNRKSGLYSCATEEDSSIWGVGSKSKDLRKKLEIMLLEDFTTEFSKIYSVPVCSDNNTYTTNYSINNNSNITISNDLSYDNN